MAFGGDLIPWDGVMGQGTGPMHHQPGNLGVNNKHRGERGVQTPRMGTGMGTGAAHGYQRCLCATGGGKQANCPSTTSALSISKQRPCSSPRTRGLRTKEARHKVWHVLSTPSCGKGGRHSIITSHTGFNMPEHILCLLKKKQNPNHEKECIITFAEYLSAPACRVCPAMYFSQHNVTCETFYTMGTSNFSRETTSPSPTSKLGRGLC